MNINIQIISLLFSFIMGVILYLICSYHYIVIKNNNICWKLLTTTALMIDYNLLYLVGLYYINNGTIHIYFLFMVIVGFYLAVKFMPTIRKFVNYFIKRWYNKNNRRVWYEIKNVKKSYGEGGSYVQVLKGVNTCVEKGQMCVIQGTSGSGKSTLLNCIGGLDTMDSGSIIVDGTEIYGMKNKTLSEYRRAKLGFIFQVVFLNNTLAVPAFFPFG